MSRMRMQAPTRRLPRSSGFQGRIAEVDLRLLRVFACVADHGGFAAAELALGKSKSSISIDIAALESRLNMVLCHRGRAGFALTREGEGVLEATQRLFSDLDMFQQRINDVSGTLTGRFCLYLPDNIQFHGETALLRAIQLFATRHPAVTLDVRSASTRDVEFAVRNGTATAGITLYPLQRPDMEATPLFSERSNLYCGVRHPLFDVPEERIDVAALAATRMIDVSDAASSPRWDELKPAMTFSATAENIDSRALLILSGMYVGFLPELFVTQMVQQDRLRHIRFNDLHLVNHFYFLIRPTPENGLLAEAFRAALEETR
ncbi:LysR family transcriptional regulator [Swaminathania salitolerans LMG 21291]|uniref:LysR family transcriptional regulator n=2 Tax=Swaminathania salitolerans TaxID=182838 RepID=A0A511BQ93_9PROT|nr:LysR family transcriptional regulator [Swaminathania salitolerans LMG 21291]GEL02490.1 LysR family transcriptional regulator [Swaminathania salitolerans]